VNYNLVLDAAAKQAALGWTLEVAAPARRVAVRVMDATGHDLPGAVVTATARRALGTSDAIPLELAAAADGFVASGTLPAAGNWLIDVAVLAQGRLYRATRRLDVL
jgi:nitrogen fixation protein FixH